MIFPIYSSSGQHFSLRPMKAEEVPAVAALCDQCVGEGLYSQQDLCHAIAADDQFFYVLHSDDGQLVGYLYYYFTTLDAIAAFTKLASDCFQTACPQVSQKAGRIQSIGLQHEYRGQDLSERLIDFSLRDFAQQAVPTVFGVCWKMGTVVPMQKPLLRCGFQHLTTAKKVWYDDEDLFCPYCQGRCHCDAEVYYKILD